MKILLFYLIVIKSSNALPVKETDQHEELTNPAKTLVSKKAGISVITFNLVAIRWSTLICKLVFLTSSVLFTVIIVNFRKLCYKVLKV